MRLVTAPIADNNSVARRSWLCGTEGEYDGCDQPPNFDEEPA
jgi:hypothetical protein